MDDTDDTIESLSGKKDGSVVLCIKVESGLKVWLDKESKKRGVSRSKIVRVAIKRLRAELEKGKP